VGKLERGWEPAWPAGCIVKMDPWGVVGRERGGGGISV